MLKEITVNVGPHHPATLGPLTLKLRTDGEMVMSGEPEVGYLHRGIEKTAEKLSWIGFQPFIERVDYLAAMHCNLAYALAVEKLAKITVSPRANSIRLVVTELNRIGSHLLSLGFLAKQLGASTFFLYSLREREKINNLFEMLCGARLLYNYIRIGGVSADITEGFIEKTHNFLDYLTPKVKEYNDILTNNQIFIGRLKGVGTVSSEVAVSCGLSGPNLRATGIRSDVRLSAPYCGISDYEFNVPVGTGQVGQQGDALDRYCVRLVEIDESTKIIRQVLDKIPPGESGDYRETLPKVFKPGSGEAYAAVESPRGTFGVYVASDGGKTPARVRFKTPSFSTLNLFSEVLKNVFVSDVSTIVGSLDIMVSEVDR